MVTIEQNKKRIYRDMEKRRMESVRNCRDRFIKAHDELYFFKTAVRSKRIVYERDNHERYYDNLSVMHAQLMHCATDHDLKKVLKVWRPTNTKLITGRLLAAITE